jgi:Family of unknown function (DUF6104)
MYFTDRGIEELESRRGDEEVSLAWLAERLTEFTDLYPDSEPVVDRLATWLARLDDDDPLDGLDSRPGPGPAGELAGQESLPGLDGG